MIGNGIGNACGAGIVIDLCGRSVVLPPLTLEDFGTIEHVLVARRPDVLTPALGAIASLPPARQIRLANLAFDADAAADFVSPGDVAAFITSDFEGIALSLFIPLDRRYPLQFPLPHVLDYVTSLSPPALAELVRQRDIASNLRPRRSKATGCDDQHVGVNWRLLFWRLTAPIEVGGRGMQPSEVRKLTMAEVRIYVASESQVRLTEHELQRDRDFLKKRRGRWTKKKDLTTAQRERMKAN